jgi:serine/threonine protein kinase
MADVEAELAKFFQIVDKELPDDFRFSDADVRKVGSLLSALPQAKPSWSRVPRVYIVLRLIDQHELLDQFIQQGFSDYLFPVNANGLPNCLDVAGRVAFVKVQRLVCTKAVDLEKGGHQVFAADQSKELFTVNKVLGTSATSQVDHVTSNLSFEEYARKRIVRRTTGPQRFSGTASIFIGELTILKRLKHEHIVTIHGSYTDPRYFVLLLSPIAECNLAEYFAKVRDDANLKVTLRTFFGCLTTAVAYLHRNLVKHKDIKPQNILVHRGSVLLTDFGIARLAEDASGVTTDGWTLKTPRYCAPEVASYDQRNNSSDIWSLGCVFLEIMTTLKGHSVADMTNFFHTQGSRETNLSANEQAIGLWIKQLETEASKDENRPLSWIKPMLHHSRNIRPTALSVARQIYDNHDGGLYMYGGFCCNDGSDDVDLSDMPPSPRSESVTSRNDTLDRSADCLEQIPSQKPLLLITKNNLEHGDLSQFSLPAVTKPDMATTVLPNAVSMGLEIMRNIGTESIPLQVQRPHDQSAIVHEPVLSPLHSAAQAAALRIFKSAMRKRGRDFAYRVSNYVHDGGDFEADALFKAIDMGDLHVLEFLLQSGLDVNAVLWRTTDSVRPLEAAIQRYLISSPNTGVVVALLLEHGAQLQVIDQRSKFECFKHACKGAFFLVDKLLKAGYDIRDLGPILDSHDFLHAACSQTFETVDLLLQSGVRHWPRNSRNESALQVAMNELKYGKLKSVIGHSFESEFRVLFSLLRAGIVPQTQKDRLRLIKFALFHDKPETLEILSEQNEPMIASEAAYGMQLWYIEYSEYWPDSSLSWYKTFFAHGLNPFGKFDELPHYRLYKTDVYNAIPSFCPIRACLWEMAPAIGKLKFDESVELITEQLASVHSSSRKVEVECWPIVDSIATMYFHNQPIDATQKDEIGTFFLQVVTLCKDLKIPQAVLQSDQYSRFCDSELIAAICYDSDIVVKVLLDAGVDANGLVLDRGEEIYRSPLNVALNPPKVPLKSPKVITQEWLEWHERRGKDVIELLKGRGAKDITKKLGVAKRFSRSLKWKHL